MATEKQAGGTPEQGRKGEQGQGAQAAGAGAQAQAQAQAGREAGQQAAGQGMERRDRGGRGGMLGRMEPFATELFGPDLLAMSPFAMMRRMMEDLDRMFEGGGMARGVAPGRAMTAAMAFAPQVDVFRRDGSVVVRADLPGIRREDVHVDLEEDALILSGERREEQEERREGLYRAERRLGSFRRVIPLPEGIEPDACQAHFENGVLEVVLPLAQEKARGRRIDIQEGKPGRGMH